ncbi:MAG: replicative DNA helicase [Myxococcota bacterium]|nr:replicative DNA helicase [Myxococcota bacterium]
MSLTGDMGPNGPSFSDDGGASGRRSQGRASSGSDSTNLSGRVPPHDLDAEKAVLSAIMIDPDVLHQVFEQINAEDFYHPSHQILYAAIVQLRDSNQPVDLTVIAGHLRAAEQLEAIGGVSTLAEISDYEATPANVEHYARIIKDKSVKRNLISVASEIVAAGFDPSEEAGKLLDHAESKIFELSQAKAQSSLEPLDMQMSEAFDHIEMLMTRGGELTGCATGFGEFDKMTGGLQPGDLIIVAARPSMGKTALTLNIARNAAVLADKHVAVFSLEMTTRSLVMRMLSSEAEVDFSTFHKGLISVDAHGRLADAAGKLSRAGIWIDDTGAPSVLEIRAKCRRLKAQQGLDMVIVDYLQLAHGDGKIDSREQEISQISRGLKGLAKELNIPVVALSQLNRGPESRGAEDKRPMLADLRESGAIEQDADVIGFIYRDVVYNKATEYPDKAELIIAKQRNGPVGTVNLKFEGRFARFSNWDQNDFDEGFGAGGTFGVIEPPTDGGDTEVPF